MIDADGKYLGKYRKTHIPHCKPGLLGEVLLPARQPRLSGLRDRATRKIGVYICYDRHSPKARARSGLNGAEIVFNPSATVAGLSEYLWKLEQPAHAVANGYFVGAINRVGPRGALEHRRVLRPELLLRPARPDPRRGRPRQGRGGGRRPGPRHDRRGAHAWQFYRDRRPDAYGPLVQP